MMFIPNQDRMPVLAGPFEPKTGGMLSSLGELIKQGLVKNGAGKGLPLTPESPSSGATLT